jgi:ESS family glutamate:Na+ symporter
MADQWGIVMDILYLSVFLGIGTFLKRKVPFFKRFLIPNGIIAGFVGLVLGPEILGRIMGALFPGKAAASLYVHLDLDRLGTMVYHLMAVGFIALSLKKRDPGRSQHAVNTGIFIVSNYLVQGILGFGLSLLFVYTIQPDLFPAMGLLLPLGFGQGPGQALSMGSSWEAEGFRNGGNVGLAVATIGFLWATIGGVPFMNYLVRKRKFVRPEDRPESRPKSMDEDEAGEIPLGGSIDRLSVQIFQIGIVYLITYGIIIGLSALLVNFGNFGKTISNLLWGFHFIIAALVALATRASYKFFMNIKIMSRNYPNNFLLQRIAGAAFDYMIAASIAALSWTALKEYLLPVVVITTIGGFVTAWFCSFIAKRIYPDHVVENTLGMFGMMTGTISTGMGLLREVDPNYDSGAAENLVLGSGTGLFFGFPLMIVLSIPIIGVSTGQPIMFLYTFIAFIAYLAILLTLLFMNVRRQRRKG